MSLGNVVDLRGKKPRFWRTSKLPLKSGGQKKTPLRARRRRARLALALAILLTCGLFVWGISWLSYLSQFSIQDVSVIGASSVDPQSVASFVKTELQNGSRPLLSRNNIFLYPRAQLERDVVSFFPRVRAVHISRPSLLATVLTVTIEERQPYARWCSGACYLLDETGFVFAPAASSTPGIATPYVFEGGISGSPIGQTYLPAHLTGIQTLLDRLGQAGWQAETVIAQADQDFSVVLATSLPAGGQGFSIRASFGEDIDQLVRNLQLVLTSQPLRDKQDQLEYVDLRFGNRVYYKLKGGTPVQSQ